MSQLKLILKGIAFLVTSDTVVAQEDGGKIECKDRKDEDSCRKGSCSWDKSRKSDKCFSIVCHDEQHFKAHGICITKSDDLSASYISTYCDLNTEESCKDVSRRAEDQSPRDVKPYVKKGRWDNYPKGCYWDKNGSLYLNLVPDVLNNSKICWSTWWSSGCSHRVCSVCPKGQFWKQEEKKCIQVSEKCPPKKVTVEDPTFNSDRKCGEVYCNEEFPTCNKGKCHQVDEKGELGDMDTKIDACTDDHQCVAQILTKENGVCDLHEDSGHSDLEKACRADCRVVGVGAQKCDAPVQNPLKADAPVQNLLKADAPELDSPSIFCMDCCKPEGSEIQSAGLSLFEVFKIMKFWMRFGVAGHLANGVEMSATKVKELFKKIFPESDDTDPLKQNDEREDQRLQTKEIDDTKEQTTSQKSTDSEVDSEAVDSTSLQTKEIDDTEE